MHRQSYDYGVAAGRFAALIAFPVVIGLFFVYQKLEEIDGVTFLPTSLLSVSVLIALLMLLILTSYWRSEAGDGVFDTLITVAAWIPFLVVLSLFDPWGAAPWFF
jgi:membrane protein insertase Oxa1/YidC/SpoIIIJ